MRQMEAGRRNGIGQTKSTRVYCPRNVSESVSQESILRSWILFLGLANDGCVFQAQFPKTSEEPAPKSQDFRSRRNHVIQQSGSGRRMCDIHSCISSIIGSTRFGGKEIPLSQRTHALYFYKNADKTSSPLHPFFPNFKDRKMCTV